MVTKTPSQVTKRNVQYIKKSWRKEKMSNWSRIMMVFSFLSIIAASIFYVVYNHYFAVFLSYESIEAQVKGYTSSPMLIHLIQDNTLRDGITMFLIILSLVCMIKPAIELFNKEK